MSTNHKTDDYTVLLVLIDGNIWSFYILHYLLKNYWKFSFQTNISSEIVHNLSEILQIDKKMITINWRNRKYTLLFLDTHTYAVLKRN